MDITASLETSMLSALHVSTFHHPTDDPSPTSQTPRLTSSRRHHRRCPNYQNHHRTRQHIHHHRHPPRRQRNTLHNSHQHLDLHPPERLHHPRPHHDHLRNHHRDPHHQHHRDPHLDLLRHRDRHHLRRLLRLQPHRPADLRRPLHRRHQHPRRLPAVLFRAGDGQRLRLLRRVHRQRRVRRHGIQLEHGLRPASQPAERVRVAGSVLGRLHGGRERVGVHCLERHVWVFVPGQFADVRGWLGREGSGGGGGSLWRQKARCGGAMEVGI